MKGKKCFGLLLALFIIFGLSLNVFSDVSAISYSDSSFINLSSCKLVYNNGGSISFNTSNGGCNVSLSGISNTSGVNYLALVMPSGVSIPANTIVAITLKIATYNMGSSASNIFYPQVGWTTKSQAYSLIDSSMGEYGTNYSYFYFDREISGEVDLFPATTWGNFAYLDMKVSSISYTALNYQPTAAQITQLQNTLNEINAKSSTTNSNLQIIRGYLEDIISNSDRTADAVEEQNERDEQDRDNMTTQQSDIDSDSSDLGSDAESATSTLSGNISSIIGAFSTNATDCIIPVNTGNLNLNNLNICSMPSEFRSMTNNISSIVITVAVLWTSYSIIRQFLGIYESFLAGGRS